MGRPRLYNTPKEKKAAKATNSKWSYVRFTIYSVPLYSNSEIIPRHQDHINNSTSIIQILDQWFQSSEPFRGSVP